MQDALTMYFSGEKNGGLLLTGIGLLGLAAAALFFQARWGLRSFAVTLAVVALIEIAIGVGLSLRAGPQVSDLLAQLGSDAARFGADEGTRMGRVQRTFVVVQYIEVIVIVVAAITAVALKSRFSIAGIAFGLLLNAALLLAFRSRGGASRRCVLGRDRGARTDAMMVLRWPIVVIPRPSCGAAPALPRATPDVLPSHRTAWSS